MANLASLGGRKTATDNHSVKMPEWPPRNAETERRLKELYWSGKWSFNSEAEQLFEKVQARKTERELSLDELEAVSGGADRDWLTEGCANLTTTSYCWTGLDYCDLWDVTYTHEPFAYPCRYCGRDNAMYQASDTGYTDGLSCKFCHASDNKQLLKDYWAAHPRIAHQA